MVQKLLGVLEDLQAKHVLASTANVPPLRQLLPQIDEGQLTGVHDLAQLDLSSPAERYPVIEPTDILFYQLTSGSTGRSKCIPERHCAVVSHIRHSIAHCGYLMTDVMCNWLPFDHVVPMLHACSRRRTISATSTTDEAPPPSRSRDTRCARRPAALNSIHAVVLKL